MSRTVDSKSHLRNRSSTTRFGTQDSASLPFHPQKPRLDEVSDADRGKLQSFKFPSPTSSPRTSVATSDSFAIIGLPTPPPDLQFFPDHGFAMPSTEVMKGPSAQYEIQYRTSCEVAADLVPMEGHVEETYEEHGRDSESSWSPYRWPLKSDSSHESGLMKSPYGGHFVTPSVGASHYINTYRIKRGVIFRRGLLPSASVVRTLLIGSWLAMLMLIVLAILFIVKS